MTEAEKDRRYILSQHREMIEHSHVIATAEWAEHPVVWAFDLRDPNAKRLAEFCDSKEAVAAALAQLRPGNWPIAVFATPMNWAMQLLKPSLSDFAFEVITGYFQSREMVVAVAVSGGGWLVDAWRLP